jgi:3-dehydroquinate dehydratase/shikimate dehydrogenase
MAGSFRDNDMVFELYERAKRDRQQLIAIAMGPFGQISRILPGCQNAFLTYGVAENGSFTAPGQFTAAELDRLYRVRNLDKRTKIFGLLGNPVAQSKGIYFHNGIFRKKKVNAVYVNFLIDDLAHFFHRHAHRLTGASVTMPFKSEVLRYMDTISDDCRQLGAVNTVIRKRGKLSGTNTDYLAITQILRKKISVRNREVVVLGTGATATTMAFAARQLGARVRILGRNAEKARSLAERFDLQWAPLDNIENVACDLLMNAIPTQPTPIVPETFLRRGTAVFDAVYHPPITPLLQSAQSAGCPVISGLELFTAQARLQSKLFLEAAS